MISDRERLSILQSLREHPGLPDFFHELHARVGQDEDHLESLATLQQPQGVIIIAQSQGRLDLYKEALGLLDEMIESLEHIIAKAGK